MARIAIKHIRPNPYRHIERYPINAEKLAALRESLQATGYWDNIVGRPAEGSVEIAYGHHRLAALEKEYGRDKEVEVILRDLTDDLMLKIMARENIEVFGTSAVVEQETVRAVVEAAAAGTIQLEKPPSNMPKSQIRWAPSFLPGEKPASGPMVPYTNRSIGAFLGWLDDNERPQRKVSSSLWALQLIEEGLLKDTDFNRHNSSGAEAIVVNARRKRQQLMDAAEAERKAAEWELKQAKKREEEAKKKQGRLEREAARAKSAAEKKRKEAAAEEAEEQSQRLEEERRYSEKALAEEKEREVVKKREATKTARKVARGVSKAIREGKTSAKRADEVADEISPRPAGPPAKMEDRAGRLAAKLNGVLDPERDRQRVLELTSLIKWRKNLSAARRAELTKSLRGLADRAESYARELEA